MNDKTIIYVCPHGCYAPLKGDVEVQQTWKVDFLGNPVECLDEDTSFMEVDSMFCKSCGATAEELKCVESAVFDGKGNRIGTMYLPDDDSGYVYYLANDDECLLRRLDLCHNEDTAYVILNNVRYFQRDEGFIPPGQVEGQMSLLGMEE